MHHEDAVRHPQDLRHLGGDHYHRHPGAGQFDHQPVHLDLGADVDPLGRLAEQEDGRPGLQPPGDHDLLLVSPGEGADHLVPAVRADIEAADRLLHERPLLLLADNPSGADPPHRREGDVVAHTHAQDEPEGLAVLGHEADPQRDRLGRGPDRHPAPLHGDLAAVERDHAEDGVGHLDLPGADQAGDPEDLPAARGKRDVPKQALGGQPPDRQPGRAGRDRRLGKLLGQPPAHHPLDEPLHVDLARRVGPDVVAVPQHGDPVGDTKDLLQPVGDVDHRHPPRPQLTDDREEPLDFLERQGRGRLVHDQDVGPEAQRPGDLHGLPLGDAQEIHPRPGVDGHPEGGELLSGAGAQHVPVHEPAPAARLIPQEQVLGRRKRPDQVQLLVDDGDAQLPRAPRGGNGHPLPLEEDLPPVRLVDAPEDADEGRLARAVLPHQRVHLTRQHVQVDAGERLHPGKFFDDAPHPEDGLRGRGGPGFCRRRAGGGRQNATPLRSSTLA